MKVLFISAALLATFIAAAGCIAEVMGSPSEELPFMMIADRILAAGCLIACGVAAIRMLPAVALIWSLIVIHGALCCRYDVPGQLLHGVLLVLLSLITWTYPTSSMR